MVLTYGSIKKISKYFDKNILLLLYNSLMISHIRYGIGTWYNGNKTTVQKIGSCKKYTPKITHVKTTPPGLLDYYKTSTHHYE